MPYLINGLEKNYLPGNFLYKAGDLSDNCVYYILSGMVDHRIEDEGRKILSQRVIAHHLFGLISVFTDDQQRIETVKAVSPLKVYVWQKEDFLKICAKSLKLLALTLQDLSKQLREVNSSNNVLSAQKGNEPSPLKIILESR